MRARLWMAVITIAALCSAPFSFAADEKIGIFEAIHVSSVSFEETTAAVEAALTELRAMQEQEGRKTSTARACMC